MQKAGAGNRRGFPDNAQRVESVLFQLFPKVKSRMGANR